MNGLFFYLKTLPYSLAWKLCFRLNVPHNTTCINFPVYIFSVYLVYDKLEIKLGSELYIFCRIKVKNLKLEIRIMQRIVRHKRQIKYTEDRWQSKCSKQ